jgi:hypothetical protein
LSSAAGFRKLSQRITESSCQTRTARNWFPECDKIHIVTWQCTIRWLIRDSDRGRWRVFYSQSQCYQNNWCNRSWFDREYWGTEPQSQRTIVGHCSIWKAR